MHTWSCRAVRRTGILTQQDPIGIAGGLNLYGFAGGDPVNFSDPFGLCERPGDPKCRTIFGIKLGYTVGYKYSIKKLGEMEAAFCACISGSTGMEQDRRAYDGAAVNHLIGDLNAGVSLTGQVSEVGGSVGANVGTDGTFIGASSEGVAFPEEGVWEVSFTIPVGGGLSGPQVTIRANPREMWRRLVGIFGKEEDPDGGND